MSSLLTILRNLSPSRILAIGLVMVGIMGFFAYLIGTASTPSLSLLYSQLDVAEALKIIERLDALGVPYEAKGDGTHIYVPSDRVARLRMEMAQDGLPEGGLGYELFDKTDIFSVSGSMMDINKLRALEGELAKSIGSITGVNRARVHVVLPKHDLFSRDKTEPSASIVLKMKGSNRLNASQVQAIQHLVASAVPQLQPDHIAIVDDKGTLLAKNHEGTSGNEALLTQMEARLAFEHKLAKTVESLLEKSLGPGKAKVEVAADLDFDRITINSEDFNPEGQVARSISNTGEDNKSSESGGSAITAQNSLPSGGKSNGDQGSSTTKRTEESTTYEISKTIKVHHKELGTIRNLSVAVLVDGTYGQPKEGKPTYAPRSAEELEKIKLLVKTAIGYKEERKDSVEVINMQFSPNEIEDVPRGSSSESWLPSMDINKVIQLSILGVVGFLILLLIIRPIITRLIETNPVISQMAMAEGLLPPPLEVNQNGAAMLALGTLPSNSLTHQPTNDINMPPSLTSYPEQGATAATKGDANGESTVSPPPLSETVLNVIGDGGQKLHLQSLKKVGEAIDSYPEDVVTLLRTWMYEEPWKK